MNPLPARTASRFERSLKAGFVGALLAILFTAFIRQANELTDYIAPAIETFLFVFAIRYILLMLRRDPIPPAP